MLEACEDIPVRRMLGRTEALPFADATFDIVTCAWALETCSAPKRALDELRRVVRPGGVLCLALCADKPNSGLLGSLARGLLMFRGTGHSYRLRMSCRCCTAPCLAMCGSYRWPGPLP